MNCPGHVAVIDGESMTIECRAPGDALCHAEFDCGCDYYYKLRVEDGLPVHDNYDGERHVGKFDHEYCFVAEWIWAADVYETRAFGDMAVIPVTVEWDEDGPTWAFKGHTHADVLALAEVLYGADNDPAGWADESPSVVAGYAVLARAALTAGYRKVVTE